MWTDKAWLCFTEQLEEGLLTESPWGLHAVLYEAGQSMEIDYLGLNPGPTTYWGNPESHLVSLSLSFVKWE